MTCGALSGVLKSLIPCVPAYWPSIMLARLAQQIGVVQKWLSKITPFAGQAVEFRSLHNPVTHTTESVGAMIVCQHKKDIRAFLGTRCSLRNKGRSPSRFEEVPSRDFHVSSFITR